jgi:hypothetical protein
MRLNAKDKQDARIALLKHYSSECITHSIYLLTLTITFLSFVEVTPHLGSSTLLEKLVTATTLSLVTSILTSLTAYILGRTIVFSYLKSTILSAKPKNENEIIHDSNKTTITFLLQLHEGCLDYVKKKHEFWGRFYSLKTQHLMPIWTALFITFLLISLSLLHL